MLAVTFENTILRKNGRVVFLFAGAAVTGSVRSWGREAASGPTDVRRWGGMPKKEPLWLQVVIRVVLDWRFLVALAVLIRVLLNR